MTMRLAPVLVSLMALAGSAEAACTTTPAVQWKPFVDAFLVRPEGLLEQFPIGGVDLAMRVSYLLTNSPVTVLPLMPKLIKASGFDQKRAVGQALRASITDCRYREPETARKILEMVRKVDDKVIIAAVQDVDDTPKPASTPGSDDQKGRGVMTASPFGRPGAPFQAMPLPGGSTTFVPTSPVR